MKFLLFSDLHHVPGVFMGGTVEDLRTLQQRAVEEQCEFIIHAGDVCHGPSKYPEMVQTYDDSPVPSYHCLGNHDSDATPYPQLLEHYRMPGGYYYFDQSGYRMIVCDTNYLKRPEGYVNYSGMNYYKFADCRDYVPPKELGWLERTIDSSPYPCILISHASFERPDGVKNRAQVRQILKQANRKKKHSVLMCINGHYHRDHVSLIDGILFMEVNSASYDWLPKSHGCYPQRPCQQISPRNHTLVYDRVLSAVVTVEGTRITVQGTKGDYFLNVTPQMTGNNPDDAAGRPISPHIRSFSLQLP